MEPCGGNRAFAALFCPTCGKCGGYMCLFHLLIEKYEIPVTPKQCKRTSMSIVAEELLSTVT